MNNSNHLTYAEISKDKIAHNYNIIKKLLNPKTNIIAVVKANAYGHDYFLFSKEAIKNGAKVLAVAKIEEAIEIREKGISNIPILILGYCPYEATDLLVKYRLTPTIYNFNTIKKISKEAKKLKSQINIHIKIDTGMGRLGFMSSDKTNGVIDISPIQIREIQNLECIFLEGIYSHFACADESDKTFTKFQLNLFQDFLRKLEKENVNIPIKHIANSAAAIDISDTHYDFIRLGIAGYGLNPSKETKKIGLKPILSLKSKIVHLKKVKKDFKMSYGLHYKTDQDTIIATIPIGYADGLRRFFSSKGFVLINGKKRRICGNVCMDQILVDIENDKEVKLGDEVVIYGKQRDIEITVDRIADELNTINYEIVSNIAHRVGRIYI